MRRLRNLKKAISVLLSVVLVGILASANPVHASSIIHN